MSGSLHTWYSLPDLDRLAERSTLLSGEIQLDKLARLRELLRGESGKVRASLKFTQRREGWLMLDLAYQATLPLVCQRCLEPLAHEVDETVELMLVDDASSVPESQGSREPVVLEGDRFMPAMLIEDELLMSLPLVPRHPDIRDCGALADRVLQPAEETSLEARERGSRLNH